MVQYVCDRCGYTTKRKSNFRNHLYRKKTCPPLIEDIDIEMIQVKYDFDIEKKENYTSELPSCPTSKLSITIPDGTVTIDNRFSNCQNIEHVIFNNDGKLKQIGSNAFYNCKEINKNVKYIIAPHEVSEKNINRIKSKLNNKVNLLSDNKYNAQNNVLIINKIGVLKYLYKFSNISYVGGGFKKKGLHNIRSDSSSRQTFSNF